MGNGERGTGNGEPRTGNREKEVWSARMSDELKHECAVAMVVLRKTTVATGDFGGTKLSLLLEKQHNRGQDGAGAAILFENPALGSPPYWTCKSASDTPLADILGMIGKRSGAVARGEDVVRDSGLVARGGNHEPPATNHERIFLGHLRYATFGKNDVAFCHPFVHKSSCLNRTLLLAGNFNLTDNQELFDDYVALGHHPDSRADGYLLTQLMAHQLGAAIDARTHHAASPADSVLSADDFSGIIGKTLASADGAWMLCGMTGDGWAFATRDPHGIRPGFYYVDENVAVVASERPAIQAAFDVPPEAVKEVPPGAALLVSPTGEVSLTPLTHSLTHPPTPTPCAFERIYFSRANDADIHRERKALGAALLPQVLEAADAPLDDIFFSYIPNSARIAFHGLLEELFSDVFMTGLTGLTRLSVGKPTDPVNPVNLVNPVKSLPRFGEVAVKDAKFRTFIADAAARREFYKHVYDVTYGLVKKDDTLIVLDDSIVRGNTMKNAILPMLDRLGPKRIVVASSAPPIRYPDCYGIDMSTLGELVAFRALVNLLGPSANSELRHALTHSLTHPLPHSPTSPNPLAALYARFTDAEHSAEIARLLTPPGIRAEVVVVYQTVENLRRCLCPASASRDSSADNSQLSTLNSQLPIGDWYFTGDYPTPGGYKVLHTAIRHYLEKNNERSY